MQPTAAALHNVCANERVVLDWNYSNLFQTWLPDSQYIRRLRARTHAAIDRQQLKPAEPAAPNPVRQRQADCTASCRVAAQLPHPQRWRAHPALLGGKPRRNYKATQHGYDLRPDAAGPPHAGRACRHGDQGWPRRRVARVASRSKTPSRAESRVALNKTESFDFESSYNLAV